MPFLALPKSDKQCSMSSDEASAPLAILTAIEDGKILSVSVYDGSEVGENVVRVVNRFPKITSPAGTDFLVNGTVVMVGNTRYTVSGVETHKSCYAADPVQNKAFRNELDRVQAYLEYNLCLYRNELERHALAIRLVNKPGTVSPQYSRIFDQLRQYCRRDGFISDIDKPDIEEAIGDLGTRFYQHVYSPSRFSRLSSTVARYLPYGRAYARPVDQSEQYFKAARSFFETHRLYMDVLAALRANHKLAQQPFFVLTERDRSGGFLRVYEGEPFSVPCSDRVFTAHTVRGVPFIRFEPADGRPRHYMVVEGGCFKVDSVPSRAPSYAVNDRICGVQDVCTRPHTVYTVSRVSEPMGIADIPCDDDEFAESWLIAFGAAAGLFEPSS